MKAEEFFNKNYKLEAKKGRTLFKPAKWVFEFAEVYLQHRVNEADKNKLITSIRTAPSRKDADAYTDWWFKNKILKT